MNTEKLTPENIVSKISNVPANDIHNSLKWDLTDEREVRDQLQEHGVILITKFGQQEYQRGKAEAVSILNNEQLREIGKKMVEYDRQVALFGEKAALNVLYFWMQGAKYVQEQLTGAPPQQGKEGEEQ